MFFREADTVLYKNKIFQYPTSNYQLIGIYCLHHSCNLNFIYFFNYSFYLLVLPVFKLVKQGCNDTICCCLKHLIIHSLILCLVCIFAVVIFSLLFIVELSFHTFHIFSDSIITMIIFIIFNDYISTLPLLLFIKG